MSHTFRHPLAQGVAACLAALAVCVSAETVSGPATLDALLARYDRESVGRAKEKLAAEIDEVAHQKYATVSRLYWFTDLASAEAAAEQQRRPILELRMLGRLDEDLSCANSRFFRATLYANQRVSRFLREHFVLYWSSERPVPRVTIDYGNGRTLVRTVTGNSAHYVLDEHGDVLDVLPGLYAPVAFQRELEGSLALAADVRDASDDERAALVVAYHGQHVIAAQQDWARLAGTPLIRGVEPLLTEARAQSTFEAAQAVTKSKAPVERPGVRIFAKEVAPESVPDDQVDVWSSAGQALYALPSPPRVLDDASRALVASLYNDVPRELRANEEQLNAMIARLEQTIVADTAINQLRLRPMIAREIMRRGGRLDFAVLNAWIYTEVFRTPKEDAWLGLLPRNVFTGLPGDGVVIRR